MADKTKGSVQTDEELAEDLSRAIPTALTDLWMGLNYMSEGQQSELGALVENARRVVEEKDAYGPARVRVRLFNYRAKLPMVACALPPQDAEGEMDAVSQLEVARNIFEEAAARLSEDLKLAEQVRAQLEEVDEIIERLGRDREEIDRLKEETRSNISELQRMIAA